LYLLTVDIYVTYCSLCTAIIVAQLSFAYNHTDVLELECKSLAILLLRCHKFLGFHTSVFFKNVVVSLGDRKFQDNVVVSSSNSEWPFVMDILTLEE
jgi:hypothetical protein